MKKVTRDEVRSRAGYEAIREDFRRNIFAQKKVRRVHVGPHLTFLFENHDTVLYQIQEMIRTEGIQGEAEIQHEIATYNELVGEPGELVCTLLIEIEDKEKRQQLLSRWKDLPETIYIKTSNGRTIQANCDRRQVGENRISSVQYLRFGIGDDLPGKLGTNRPDIATEVELLPEQVSALVQDLVSG